MAGGARHASPLQLLVKTYHTTHNKGEPRVRSCSVFKANAYETTSSGDTFMMQFRRYIPISFALALVSVVLLSACAPKIAPAPTPVLQAAPETTGVAPVVPALPESYATRTLRARSNIREQPAANAPIVATLPAGKHLGLAALDSGWFKIVADSLVGWVWAPLVGMTANDRWDAAISYASSRFVHRELFSSVYRGDDGLVIVLRIVWRDMTMAEKGGVVTETGEAWKRAVGQMGMSPPPAIRFMSNNDVVIARWHGFWGAQVLH